MARPLLRLCEGRRCSRVGRVITTADEQVVLSNLGWVDRGSIWRYNHATRRQDRIPISDGSYLRLTPSDSAESVTIQHGLSGRSAVSVHMLASLQDPVVRVDVVGWTANVSGDLDAFRGHQRLHVSYLDDDVTGAAGYFLIEVGTRDVRVRRLDWFDDKKYDHMYQSVMSVLELPSGEYLFGLQRSSELVLCDPASLAVIREVPLAGRHGNPIPFLRNHRSELWAVDYDTVLRLDVDTLVVEDHWLGQPPATDGTRMFLGSAWMPRSEQEILVARPGMADVVALNPNSMQIGRLWRTGREPLTAATVGTQLVARDWKTGDLLLGKEAS